MSADIVILQNINSGDTGWILISSALVLLMTPGLALFYAGLVTSRSAINTMNMSFICMAVVPIIWSILGYSLAFSPGNSFLGGLEYAFLNNLTSTSTSGSVVPQYAPMIFQMMFAIVTPALISGALVGRIKFKAYVLFVSLWSLIIYTLIAHWIWSPHGWIDKMGAIDFAGGTVVHISSGFSALTASIILPNHAHKERAKGELPHNVPFVILGCSLLWFGWFGFNGGSAGAANGIAALAYITTALASAASALTWMIINWVRSEPTTAVGSAVAVVIGLVAITPSAGYVSPMSAILIGMIASVICYFAIIYKNKIFSHIHDPLDVFICHGISGVIGSLLAGVFASTLINPAGPNGLIHGNPVLLLYQSISVIAVIITCMLGTSIILYFLKLTMSIEPSVHDIETGIDVLEHGESAYEELNSINQQLKSSLHERDIIEKKSAVLNSELIEASRRAGMADIATNMLHNIGNVLNSVNTSISVINETIIHSEMKNLDALNKLIKKSDTEIEWDHVGNLITLLSQKWGSEKDFCLDEIKSLQKGVDHIKNIIMVQQSLSRSVCVYDETNIHVVIEDALELNKLSHEHTNIHVVKNFSPLPKVVIDRVKLLQIMVNLIKNGADAMLTNQINNRRFYLSVEDKNGEDFIIRVTDNGVGISSENITQIFSHGFTTKKDGHGFGLHNSALAAQEMGGNLVVFSNGLGTGATFLLTLPYHPKKIVREDPLFTQTINLV